jgi:hypothetical protein
MTPVESASGQVADERCGLVFCPGNRLPHRGSRGAHPARREEGAYSSATFNRRVATQNGMYRFPDADAFSGQDPGAGGG